MQPPSSTPPILALAIGLFTLSIIALHFYKTRANNERVSSSSATTDGRGSVSSASPNPEQSPGVGRGFRKGQKQGSFHVFLSFRGTDVRSTFLGHLYDAFVREGIRPYIDDEELRKGEEINDSLMRAIEDSRIAVVLLSDNYASSRWCLGELAKIMKRRKEGKIVVKPVFYRVDPREVRTPRESFAKALAAHEAKLGKDSYKVKRWRQALSEVGSLSGWHLDARGCEAELVRNIVEDVNALLDCPRLDVAKYPVGMEARVEMINDLLRLVSFEVLLIGLWGMCGVGKTTLSKAVFNAIADQFEGCAFLQNVREESTNPNVGLTKLQEKLLLEGRKRKDVKVSSTAGGGSLTEDPLSSEKVQLSLNINLHMAAENFGSPVLASSCSSNSMSSTEGESVDQEVNSGEVDAARIQTSYKRKREPRREPAGTEFNDKVDVAAAVATSWFRAKARIRSRNR